MERTMKNKKLNIMPHNLPTKIESSQAQITYFGSPTDAIMADETANSTGGAKKIMSIFPPPLPILPPPCSLVVFWDNQFHGESWIVPAGYFYIGTHWDRQISSLIVYNGIWEFFGDKYFRGPGHILGIGSYPNVDQYGIPNDWIRSIHRIA
jgi:hypothetical protein